MEYVNVHDNLYYLNKVTKDKHVLLFKQKLTFSLFVLEMMSELLKEKRALETSLRKSAVGKALFNSDPQQSIKNKNKSSQKQAVPKKPTAKDEEKAKKEAAKKAKEAEKAEAEKRRNAEIAARIAQATKRISSQHKKMLIISLLL